MNCSSLGDSTTDLFLVIHQMLLVIICFVYESDIISTTMMVSICHEVY